MTYEAWRATHQDAEAAAKAAFEQVQGLAKLVDGLQGALGRQVRFGGVSDAAAAELRRLHAENQDLRTRHYCNTAEIESLQARVQELGEMARENRSKRIVEFEQRIAELKEQMQAIGAGGVEPLRKRAEAASQAAVPLPLLVRDIARDLGITVPQACIALKPLGNYSTNSAVTAEMARMLRDHFPAPAHPAEGATAQAFKTKVYQALGIGSACDEHVVFANIENLIRREHCLSAIEREFFMVETPPDEGDTGPGEECLLNWGHTPDQYVKQFAQAIATHPTTHELEASQAQRVPLTYTQINSILHSVPEDDDDAEWMLTDAQLLKIIRAAEAAHGITQEKQG